MGYVSDFEHDIFVSYASKNNPFDKNDVNDKGWVEKSQHNLSLYLNAKLGREVSIWFDREIIITGDDFENKIRNDIKKSASILIFLSNAYLGSPWCTMERQAFLKSLSEYRDQGVAGMPGNERIFIARLDKNMDEDKIPQELKGFHEKEFFNQDSKSDETLCWPLLLKTDKDYYLYNKKINELGSDIKTQLEKLKQRMESKQRQEVKPDSENGSTDNNRIFYYERLKDCDGLVIIYGEADERWVNFHLKNSYQVYKKDRPDRLYAAGVIIEPPPEIEREMLSWEPWYMKRIDCTHGFDHERMKKFCESVIESYKEDKKNRPDRYDAPLVFVHALGESDRSFAANIRRLAKEYGVDCIIPKD